MSTQDATDPRCEWLDALAIRAGETGQLLAGFDWSATALGPIGSWPVTLRAVVAAALASPAPQAILAGPDGRMIYNDGYAQLSGARHPGVFGRPVIEAWPEIADFNREVLATVLGGGALSYRDQPFVLYRNGGPEDVWFDLSYSPIPDEAGRPTAVLAIVTETTARVRAEQELAKSRERLSYALNSSGMIGTWDWHIGSGLFFPDARLAQLFSTHATAEGGMPVDQYLEAVHPDDVSRIRRALDEAIAEKAKYSEEYRLLGRDGGWRWVLARGECLYDHEGRPVRFPGAIVDITELKESEEERSILLRELNHRVKNIFAVISGLISMTARTCATPSDMAAVLRGRLAALSAAHDLIRPAVFGKQEAAETTRLDDLLDRILEPHVAHREQLRLEGPDIQLGPAAATSLALVFHELATNAAKYGALSEENGLLAVEWTASPGEVTVNWRETAALTDETPSHRGFGSQLIEMSVQRQLKGALCYDWSAAGLRVVLRAPAQQLLR